MCSCHIYLYIDTFILITKHLSMIKVLQKVIFILSDADTVREKLAGLNFSLLCFKYELEIYYFCLFNGPTMKVKFNKFVYLLLVPCTIRKQLIYIRVWFSEINCDEEGLIIAFNYIEMSNICMFCILFIQICFLKADNKMFCNFSLRQF